MPKKPVELLRIPLNVFVAPVTKEAITETQNETGESQGEVVDRAVALLALGEEIEPKARKKGSRREIEVAKLAASDVTAREVGREDIDYGSEELPTTPAASLSAVEPVIRVKTVGERRSDPIRARGIRQKGDKHR